MGGKNFLMKVSTKLAGGSGRASGPTNEELEERYQEPETRDHIIPLERLCEKLGTDPHEGMSSMAAEQALLEYGPNGLSPPPRRPGYVRFLHCMFDGFAGLLWLCALFCFVLYAIGKLSGHEEENIEWLGLIIVLICLLSGLFAHVQESKNSKIMDSFQRMVPLRATVVREGHRLRLPAELVVPGDLVEIQLGDKVPADIRIIESHGLRVENSSITGESEPRTRTAHPTDSSPLESKNLAFFSSYAVAGSGRGIVIATGDATMIGRLAGLTSQLAKSETPLAREIRHFVHLIVLVALIFGGLFFLLSLLIDASVMRAFSYFLGIVIANVPEVLLITVTTSLTLTAKKMAEKNCLVKNLEAVETLGSTSAICSDKTGTLTQNKMTVSHLWFGAAFYNFPANMLLGVERELLLEKPAFTTFVKDASLCLRAEFKSELHESEEEQQLVEERQVIGDASESGILKFCEHMISTKPFRASYPKVAEIPFNSLTKYQLSIHKDVNGFIVVVKGAPEVVLDFCSKIMTAEGTTRDFEPEDLEAARKACTELGFLGERVLAYCDYILPVDPYNSEYEFNTSSPDKYNFPTKEYRFVGLMSMQDPPRPYVYEAVHKCRSAGIKVIMVTGDHPVTAIAIAKKVGIISEGHETRYERGLGFASGRSLLSRRSQGPAPAAEEDGARSSGADGPAAGSSGGPGPGGIGTPLETVAVVVTGNELRDMSEPELDELIRGHEEIVFARTSPQQKLEIVESCQRLGEIVAVTGDGVNDSPALRKADIGVAMGIAGSDVAKNAADMILLDDNFASIVTGIEEGRLIFDNLKKSIAYTLTSSVPEMLPMLASIILGIPLPFVLELVLCVDVGTDCLPAIALAYEKPESDIMRRAPRNPLRDNLVNKRLISMTYGIIGMTQAMAGFYTYFSILMFNGFLPGDLVGLRVPWENRAVDDLNDSFGQTWDYQSRMDLLNEARTGYFISIVITQMVDLVMCKTRRNSIFQQGMDNWSVNFSFLFEAVLTCALLYVPGAGNILKTRPLAFFWYWPCLPFALYLWMCDELRRLWIRLYPSGLIERETYY